MKKLFQHLLILLFILTPVIAMSQEVEMADALRNSGKIYVVVVVISIILVGLFGYLFYLDRKISKREKTESEL